MIQTCASSLEKPYPWPTERRLPPQTTGRATALRKRFLSSGDDHDLTTTQPLIFTTVIRFRRR